MAGAATAYRTNALSQQEAGKVNHVIGTRCFLVETTLPRHGVSPRTAYPSGSRNSRVSRVKLMNW